MILRISLFFWFKISRIPESMSAIGFRLIIVKLVDRYRPMVMLGYSVKGNSIDIKVTFANRRLSAIVKSQTISLKSVMPVNRIALAIFK